MERVLLLTGGVAHKFRNDGRFAPFGVVLLHPMNRFRFGAQQRHQRCFTGRTLH